MAAEVGEWAQARTFAAKVESVALAAEVTDGDWTGTTGGVWVVATVSAEAALAPGTLDASLFLGDLRFDASERPGSSALNASTLSPGLAERGDLLVEVPLDALREHGDDARLRLSGVLNPLRDAVVDVRLDLGDLEPVPLVELTVPGRTTR